MDNRPEGPKPLWYSTPEERYESAMQRYDAEVRDILALVNNADDDRLREQSTVEGALVRCRDLGL